VARSRGARRGNGDTKDDAVSTTHEPMTQYGENFPSITVADSRSAQGMQIAISQFHTDNHKAILTIRFLF
jgi:hypothetical protein